MPERTAWKRPALLLFLLVSTAFYVLVSISLDTFFLGVRRTPELYLFLWVSSYPAVIALVYLRSKALRYAFAVVVCLVFISTLIPWHPHKRFVRDLFEVKEGMSVSQVNAIMGKYTLRVDRERERWRMRDGSVHLVDWNRVYAYPGGDANTGRIGFKDGHVVALEFSPD